MVVDFHFDKFRVLSGLIQEYYLQEPATVDLVFKFEEK